MATADRKIEINTNMVISTNPPTPPFKHFYPWWLIFGLVNNYAK